ncbi:hypothetical protein D3C87_32440 [compost metagenome]
MNSEKLTTKDEKQLIEIIRSCFDKKSTLFDLKNSLTDQLEAEECISKSEDNYQLNTSSLHVLKIILSIGEERLSTELPANVSDALIFCQEYQKVLEQPQNNVTWAGLVELMADLRAYILVELHQRHNVNILDYYLSLSDKKLKVQHSYFFEKAFFTALPKLTSNAENIKNIILHCIAEPNQSKNSLVDFCRVVGEQYHQLACQLLQFEELGSQSSIAGQIMIGMYKNNDESALQFARRYLIISPVQSIMFFGRIDFKSIDHLKEGIEIAESIDINNIHLIRNTVDIFVNVLNSQLNDHELVNRCFNNFERLLEIGNEDLRNELAWFFSVMIKGFEEQRYFFLHKFLNKGHDLTIIENYFDHFENPKYFFHFFILMFHQLGTRLDLEYFDDGLRQFWSKNQKETEIHLLEIISHQNRVFRIFGLRLMHHSFSNFNHINVLSLNSAEKQLRTLDGLVSFPFGIDSSISCLLEFRKSKFKQVVNELQKQLAKLVLESYQDYLFELIEQRLSKTKKDLAFLEPIKDTLEVYHQIRNMKAEVNDLNPFENEQDLMNLYFEIEYENKAQIMESVKSGKGTFLEHFSKPSILVRGNSWKIDGQDEVRPMGLISHSIVLDRKMFKNPDWYEKQLSNLTKSV